MAGKYRLVYGKGPHADDHVVCAQGSLQQVIAARKTSGDLVLTPCGDILKWKGWLFPWEKKDPNCYAQKMIRWGIKGWTY